MARGGRGNGRWVPITDAQKGTMTIELPNGGRVVVHTNAPPNECAVLVVNAETIAIRYEKDRETMTRIQLLRSEKRPEVVNLTETRVSRKDGEEFLFNTAVEWPK